MDAESSQSAARARGREAYSADLAQSPRRRVPTAAATQVGHGALAWHAAQRTPPRLGDQSPGPLMALNPPRRSPPPVVQRGPSPRPIAPLAPPPAAAEAVQIQPVPAPRPPRRTAAQRGDAQAQARGLFEAARQPIVVPVTRHDLGRMDIACPQCGALHWTDELLSKATRNRPLFGVCCAKGRVRLPSLLDPPEPLNTLLSSQDPLAIKFREDIWKYNRAFAFTSLGVSEDHSINRAGRGPPVFRISGELRHWSGALAPADGRLPRYAQLYVYEPRAALEARINQNDGLNAYSINTLH